VWELLYGLHCPEDFLGNGQVLVSPRQRNSIHMTKESGMVILVHGISSNGRCPSLKRPACLSRARLPVCLVPWVLQKDILDVTASESVGEQHRSKRGDHKERTRHPKEAIARYD
jgi:hypothetical protein